MAETPNIFLEFYRTTLDYRAKVISIIFASGVAVAIPNIVTFFDNRSKALNEHERQTNELLIKQEDQKLKQLEMQIAKSARYQDYVAKFIDQAMNQDIEVRIRFAEYLAAVSDESEHWNAFLVSLEKKRDDLDAKKRQLAEAQVKSIDQVQFTTLSQQIGRLEQQTKAIWTVVPGSDVVRPLSIERLLEFFGPPASNVGSSCKNADNEAFASQLASENIGKIKVTMLRPALESLKQIVAAIGRADPALADSMGNFGDLCVRLAVGMNRLSSHAFGTAIDIMLDGQLPPQGRPPTGELGIRIARVADYFEKAGWAWGGRFALPDPMHFEVGADLFEDWVRQGKLKQAPSAKVDAKP